VSLGEEEAEVNNPRKHIRSYRLRYYEMDSWGEATPLTMLNIFEETAFTHCDESGWDVYRLRRNGFGWVLLRGSIEMYRYPAYQESFSVETWMSSSRVFYGQREYVVRGESGDVMGAARSLWIFYSLERKRPVPVLPDIVAAWAPEGTRCIERDLDEVPAPDARWMDTSRTYDVRGRDIDTNGHVNNVNYMEWALEAVPREVQDTYHLTRVDGQYSREVVYGQKIWPALEPLPKEQGTGFHHGVFANPAQGGPLVAVASARTEWKPRPERK
jgi:acyl-ACP thioesterase